MTKVNTGSDIRELVKDRYAKLAVSDDSCCGPDQLIRIGYQTEELGALPAESQMGLGCGNPTGLAEARPGETVLDLGSGGGIDVFLAARAVGEEGHVIGVDMTNEMIELAKSNAATQGLTNVEFRHGLIEELPVDSDSIDLIVSNCVINLSPDKKVVFKEAYRVLKPGGRLVVSDLVALRELPEEVRQDADAWTSCLAGAILEEEYMAAIEKAGLSEIEVLARQGSEEAYLQSVTVRAVKSVRG